MAISLFDVRELHKRKALQCVLDRYGAYIVHLTTFIQDTSVRAGDRDRLKGYIR